MRLRVFSRSSGKRTWGYSFGSTRTCELHFCSLCCETSLLISLPRYDRQVFVESGMEHVDMYFDDGSNPSDDIVRQFIQMAEMVIEGKGQKVAVHCKAGLGRTGVLIGGQLSASYF